MESRNGIGTTPHRGCRSCPATCPRQDKPLPKAHDDAGPRSSCPPRRPSRGCYDAATKNQAHRAELSDRILNRLDHTEAS